VRNRDVQPRDLQVDVYVLDGMPPGRFALRIDSLGFARTLSPAFPVEPGASTAIVVRMSRGGAITGRVVDEAGNPVANASVATVDSIDASWMNQWRAGLGGYFADVTTTATTRTDRDGQFRLDTLGLGTYSLRIRSEAFCDRVVRDLRVTGEPPAQVGQVRLERGAIVEGRITTERNPEPFWVCVFSQDPTTKLLTFRSETRSDATGRFRLADRVPAGDHTLCFQRGSHQRTAETAFHNIMSVDPHQRPLRVGARAEHVTADGNAH
jgi:hypothetical protein